MPLYQRECKPLKSNRFFLVGARGTGKTHLLRDYLASDRVWSINLLDQTIEDEYARQPGEEMRSLGITTVKFVTVADRECDFFEFISRSMAVNTAFLVRAKH